MKKMRNSKGITLVALVVTIIVLLILAGVSLNLMLGNDGIMNKTISAVETTNEASAKEQVLLKIAEFQTEYYEKKYKEHTIEADKQVGDWIFETYGQDQIQTADYTFGIELSSNMEEKDYYQVVIENNSKLKARIAGTLDQKGKLTWQGEMVDNRKFLYDKGDKQEKVTGGWVVDKQVNTNCNLDAYEYIELNSENKTYNQIAVRTQNLIDLTDYEKIHVTISTKMNGSGGYIFGINKDEIGIATPMNSQYFKATDLATGEGEKIDMMLDISDCEGDYFIIFRQSTFSIKIHSIWLE